MDIIFTLVPEKGIFSRFDCCFDCEVGVPVVTSIMSDMSLDTEMTFLCIFIHQFSITFHFPSISFRRHILTNV